jgi:hypothetical protein
VLLAWITWLLLVAVVAAAIVVLEAVQADLELALLML